MKIRTLLLGVAAATALLLTGCTPTKTGMEARASARSRLDDYSAGFTLAQAKQEFESGQFERALRDVNRAISQAPANPEAHLLKGRVVINRQDLLPPLYHFHELGAEFVLAVLIFLGKAPGQIGFQDDPVYLVRFAKPGRQFHNIYLFLHHRDQFPRLWLAR